MCLSVECPLRLPKHGGYTRPCSLDYRIKGGLDGRKVEIIFAPEGGSKFLFEVGVT